MKQCDINWSDAALCCCIKKDERRTHRFAAQRFSRKSSARPSRCPEGTSRWTKKEEKEAQIHFYISLEMLGYSRGIIPPTHNRIKPLLFPLILQRLRYYLIGCCTVWILSTKHAGNNVSRSPLCRLERARLSPKFISLLECNASVFFPTPFLSLVFQSRGSCVNCQLKAVLQPAETKQTTQDHC